MKIYIVRQVMLDDGFGSMRIDEEAIFDSYEKAEKYIKTLFENNPDNNMCSAVRNILLEYTLNDERGYPSKESIYYIDGHLLETTDYDVTSNISDFDKYSYDLKYSVGTLVQIKPNALNSESPFIEGNYGVVIQAPKNKDTWIKEGNKKDDWDGCYIVTYITPEGIADHMHLPEHVLENLDADKLPDELSFLREYSQHLKGIKTLPKTLVDNLLTDEIYLKKRKTYY